MLRKIKNWMIIKLISDQPVIMNLEIKMSPQTLAVGKSILINSNTKLIPF